MSTPVAPSARFLRSGAVVFAIAVAAWSGFLSPNSASAAGLLVADGGFGGVLEIKQQDVA